MADGSSLLDTAIARFREAADRLQYESASFSRDSETLRWLAAELRATSRLLEEAELVVAPKAEVRAREAVEDALVRMIVALQRIASEQGVELPVDDVDPVKLPPSWFVEGPPLPT